MLSRLHRRGGGERELGGVLPAGSYPADFGASSSIRIWILLHQDNVYATTGAQAHPVDFQCQFNVIVVILSTLSTT